MGIGTGRDGTARVPSGRVGSDQASSGWVGSGRIGSKPAIGQSRARSSLSQVRAGVGRTRSTTKYWSVPFSNLLCN